LINIQLTKLKTIRRTVRINRYFYWQNKLGNPLKLFWSCSGDRMVAMTSLKPEDYIYLYSISNEFRPFASPYHISPYLTVLTVFKFFKAKKRKKGWVRWGTVRYGGVRYGDGEGTVRWRKRYKFVRNTVIKDFT
jgi:hypothetical protein